MEANTIREQRPAVEHKDLFVLGEHCAQVSEQSPDAYLMIWPQVSSQLSARFTQRTSEGTILVVVVAAVAVGDVSKTLPLTSQVVASPGSKQMVVLPPISLLAEFAPAA